MILAPVLRDHLCQFPLPHTSRSIFRITSDRVYPTIPVMKGWPAAGREWAIAHTICGLYVFSVMIFILHNPVNRVLCRRFSRYHLFGGMSGPHHSNRALRSSSHDHADGPSLNGSWLFSPRLHRSSSPTSFTSTRAGVCCFSPTLNPRTQ